MHGFQSVSNLFAIFISLITRLVFYFRPNLYLEVKRKTKMYDDLRNVMRSTMVGNKEILRFDGPTIIYCPTRSKCEKLCEYLICKSFFSFYSVSSMTVFFQLWISNADYTMREWAQRIETRFKSDSATMSCRYFFKFYCLPKFFAADMNFRLS